MENQDDDNIEEFVNRYKEDEYIVSKYKKLDIPATKLVIYSFAPLATFASLLTFIFSRFSNLLPDLNQVVLDIGGVRLDLFIFVMIIIAILSFLPASLQFIIYKTRSNYPVAREDIVYHELVMSIDKFETSQYEQSLEHLNEFVNKTRVTGPFVMNEKLRHDFYDYIVQLNHADENGQLEEAFENTFEDVIQIVVDEVLEADEDDRIEQITDRIEAPSSTEQQSATYFDILDDILEPIRNPFRRFAVLFGIIVFSVIIGVQFGTEWAVVLLSGYAVYSTIIQ
jgi:hypothetical protein